MLIKKTKNRTPYESTGLFKLMSTQLNDPIFDNAYFPHNLTQYYRAILCDFKRVAKSFVNFHLLYLLLFTSEITLFFCFLPFLTKSTFFAFSLGGLFLTCFSYFVLLFYYQAKKPEQLIQLRDSFLRSCRQALSTSHGAGEDHLSLADALAKLAAYLQDFELNVYQTPKFLQSLSARLAVRFYGEDVYKMKLLLLQAAIDEHLKQIRMAPTDLEVHASLAGAYIALAKVYQEKEEEGKFRMSSRLAIEEFRILSHYAPNDPWVHEQLAIGYRDLGMPEEEMKEVETLCKLRSQDKETLFRLGTLYFKQGMNAKGLQIYENLQKANFQKAETLISSYGSVDSIVS
ncbi:MAG: hypothetical protein ACD_17C00419G0004 [uncultured bacterium]|nr:MAG: hypothetical protein ACD_17C00419G0004 [uncultured bacterium]